MNLESDKRPSPVDLKVHYALLAVTIPPWAIVYFRKKVPPLFDFSFYFRWCFFLRAHKHCLVIMIDTFKFDNGSLQQLSCVNKAFLVTTL